MGLSFLVRLAPYLAALGLLIGAFFYIKSLGKTECENNQKIAIIKASNKREMIEHDNKNLDHDSITNKLNSNGWLRND